MGWESVLLLSRQRMDGSPLPTMKMALNLETALLPTGTALKRLLIGMEDAGRYIIEPRITKGSIITLGLVLCLEVRPFKISLFQIIVARMVRLGVNWAREPGSNLAALFGRQYFRVVDYEVFKIVIDKFVILLLTTDRKLEL
jgi:hypothetical protein